MANPMKGWVVKPEHFLSPKKESAQMLERAHMTLSAGGRLKQKLTSSPSGALAAELRSFMTAQPARHGDRAKTAIQQFDDALGAGDPDQIKQALDGIMDLNRDLMKDLRAGKSPDGTEPLPAEPVAISVTKLRLPFVRSTK